MREIPLFRSRCPVIMCRFARSLGAMHDGSGNGCEPNDKYIMAPSHGYLASKSLLNNAYMFSDCSVKYFKDTLSGTSDGYARTHVRIRACTHVSVRTQVRARISLVHALTRARARTLNARTHIYTHIAHSLNHTHTHAHTNAHANTHTHAHTPVQTHAYLYILILCMHVRVRSVVV